MDIIEVPTGTKVLDWEIPQEWNVKDAYVMNEKGERIIDFRENNLHLVSYSRPVNKTVSLEYLQNHLFSLEDQPSVIPYVTSYYNDYWGFCMSHEQRETLKDEEYKVVIDSELKDGSLTYGELIIPGRSRKEVFLSTYICHPSMANNELSGPILTTFLAKWLLGRKRRYTYRIVFVPETIGSITYLSKHMDEMKEKIIAGYNITCTGDERGYSFLPSRYGNTLADKAALNILKTNQMDFVKYSFLERGSDERQYCSPGIDLPVASIMRTKYGEYPEYHTSDDNLNLVTAHGLQGSYNIYQQCLQAIEQNEVYKVKCLGEPQLGKRGLRSTLSTKESGKAVRDMMNFIAYADGENDLIDISNRIHVPLENLYPIIEKLTENDLLIKMPH